MNFFDMAQIDCSTERDMLRQGKQEPVNMVINGLHEKDENTHY